MFVKSPEVFIRLFENFSKVQRLIILMKLIMKAENGITIATLKTFQTKFRDMSIFPSLLPQI